MPSSDRLLCILATACMVATGLEVRADEAPTYEKDVVPVLRKYCVSCHAAQEPEGNLSLDSYGGIQRGGKRGTAMTAGHPESSRMLQMMTGAIKPIMPPEDNDAPNEAEVDIIRRWIEAGAKGPKGAEPVLKILATPKIAPTTRPKRPVTALAWSPDGKQIAIGRFQSIEIVNVVSQATIKVLKGLPGKVTALSYSQDGKRLIAASGVTGLFGQASLWDLKSGRAVAQFEGHGDILYAAVLSPDESTVATAGYDRTIRLWDAASGRQIRALKGHNGAIYDLAFSPNGEALASASADETVKIWSVTTGERLDTLGQPLKEQYVVRFSPNGKRIVAAGADNRIRVWRLVSTKRPAINPLLIARFAHEGAITGLEFSADGRQLVTSAEDRLIKVWSSRDIAQLHAFPPQPDSIPSLAISPDSRRIVIGRADSSIARLEIPDGAVTGSDTSPIVLKPAPLERNEVATVSEQEPNNSTGEAHQIQLPAKVTGKIAGRFNDSADADLFGFKAMAGNEIVFEIKASRDKSPLDSRIEILDANGKPIVRTLLRAVRDSYFTFRGKDSSTIDDFRVHNWEEMELNEYLYANGEVVKLWLYPRGPDSGFKVYPGRGKRYNYFGTTATSHALNENCYIVEPLSPEAQIAPNGLPVFRVYYENDDDPLREWGSDSRLLFTAPTDGQYFVRVRDARGFESDDHKYELTARARRPDFSVSLGGTKLEVGKQSGREFSFTARRIDDYDGPIDVRIDGVPDGFAVTSPVTIEPGQTIAFGTVTAAEMATTLTADQLKKIKITASATIRGKKVEHNVGGFEEIKVNDAPQILVRLLPDDGSEISDEDLRDYSLAAIDITPGETIRLRVRVIRNKFKGIVSFGKEDSGRNLPHGVYIDNIGLNGLQVLAEQNERTFFITAAKWVPGTTRVFHLMARGAGNQTSMPIELRVVPKPDSIADRN